MKRIQKIRPIYIAGWMVMVIGLLAGVCALWPEGDVRIGRLPLRFLTLDKVLHAAEEDASAEQKLTPEELMAQQAAEIARAKEAQDFLHFMESSPIRIYYPDSSYTYLDTFFMALDSARWKGLRVIHYGDSQLEEDRMSDILRNRLQTEFGGGGYGWLLPQQEAWTAAMHMTTGKNWKRIQAYGGSKGKRANGEYGPAAALMLLDGSGSVTIQAVPGKDKTLKPMQYVKRVTLVTRPTGTISASVQEQSIKIASNGERLQLNSLLLADSTTNFKLELSGSGDLLGVLMDDTVGVSVDNIPMRGCAGAVFTSLDSAQLVDYYRATNTRLLILQYGGNYMPSITGTSGARFFTEKLREQVQYLRHIAPEMRILWVGPSDMSTMIGGERKTYPTLPEFDRMLREMVTEEGCAYWSLYESMGGAGSMVEWVNTGLAGQDYIHFTRRGANQAGEWLAESLMMSYRYYALRHPNAVHNVAETDSVQTENEPTDSLQTLAEPADSLNRKEGDE